MKNHFFHIAIVIFTAIAVLYKFVIAPIDETVCGLDARYYNLWDLVLRSSILRNGILPFRNLYVASGIPYLGNPHTSIFCISSLIMIFAQNELIGLGYSLVVHTLMSGIFMYILMLTWDQEPEASLVAAIGFMLSGFFYARIFAGHIAMLYAYAWMPLVLVFLELAIQKNSVKYGALTGLVIALQVHAGGQTILPSTTLLAGLYIIYRYIVLTRSRAELGWKILLRSLYQLSMIFLVVSLFAFSLSAIRIMPIQEATLYTKVPTYSIDGAFGGAFPDVQSVVTALLSNDLSGLLHTPWGYDFWEYTFYLGPSVFIGVFSVLFARKSHVVIFLISATIVSILLSMGNRALADPLYYCIPFVRFMRVPSRYLVMTQLTIPAMAAIAITGMQKRLTKLAINFNFRFSLEKIMAYVLVVIIVLNSVTFNLPYFPESPQTIKVQQSYGMITPYLQETAKENDPYRVFTTGVNYIDVYDFARNRIESTQGHDLTLINSHEKYLSHCYPLNAISMRLLGMLNVRYIISNGTLDLVNGALLIKNFSHGMSLYRNLYYLSRVQEVSGALLLVCPDKEQWENISMQIMSQESFNLKNKMIVRGKYIDEFDDLSKFSVVYLPYGCTPAHDVAKAKQLLSLYKSKGGIILGYTSNWIEFMPTKITDYMESLNHTTSVRIVRYTPNGLRARVATAHANTFFLVSETYIPGWRLRVNGEERSPLEVNGIFFGLVLGEGEYDLDVEYEPLTYKFGTTISIISCVVLVVLCLPRRVREHALASCSARFCKRLACSILRNIMAFQVSRQIS